MTKAQKMELMRRNLAKEKKESDISIDMTDEVVAVSREMGWTIDYTLNLWVWRFRAVAKSLQRIQKNIEERNKSKSRIGR